MIDSGLIGPGSSDGTASVASLFRLSDIPVISYQATSPELGNHKRFPSFFRTIYADDKQAEALVSLVDHFEWDYITVIGSDDSIGRRGIYEFKKVMWSRTNATHLCIDHEFYFGDDVMLENILTNIQLSTRQGSNENSTTNITLLFMGWDHAVRFLKKAKEYDMLTNTTWIGVEQWTSNMSMTYNQSGFLPSSYTNGVISTEIASDVPEEFRAWFTNSTDCRILNDPWLAGYFSQQYWLKKNGTLPTKSSDCTLDAINSEDCLNVVNKTTLVRKQRRISNVITAVYALAFALDELHRQKGTLVKKDGRYQIPYLKLVQMINSPKISRKIPILSDDQAPLGFDENGNLVNATYEIHNFYAPDAKHAAEVPAVDAPVDGLGHGIGIWTEVSDALQINETLIHWKTGTQPRSQCHRHCVPGEYIVYETSQCCWVCKPCDYGTYSSLHQSLSCTSCPVHYHTNAQRDRCLPNRLIYVSYRDALGIANSIFCIMGQLLVLFSAIVSAIFRKTKEFNDRCTMKCAVLFNCSLGFTYVMYHAFSPEIILCRIRRVAWQTIITSHSVGAFFQIQWGRTQAMRLRRIMPIPQSLCPYICYAFFTGLAFTIYVILAYTVPPIAEWTDLGPITGQWDTTYTDCGESTEGLYCIGVSVIYPGLFGLTAVSAAFREVQYHKSMSALRTQQSPESGLRSDYRTVRNLLYSSYICLVVVGALTPIYFTSEDPWNKSFLLLIGIFISNSAILGIYLIPRLRKVITKRRYRAYSRHDSRLADIFVTTGNLYAKVIAEKKKYRAQNSTNV